VYSSNRHSSPTSPEIPILQAWQHKKQCKSAQPGHDQHWTKNSDCSLFVDRIEQRSKASIERHLFTNTGCAVLNRIFACPRPPLLLAGIRLKDGYKSRKCYLVALALLNTVGSMLGFFSRAPRGTHYDATI
jgi:hypothetical protein